MNPPVVVRENENLNVVVPPSGEDWSPGSRWGGLYLRAPAIFHRLLAKAGDRLVLLGKRAEIKRGFTTGANDFFYLQPLPYLPTCPLCGVAHGDALPLEEEAAYWMKGEVPPPDRLVPVANGLGWEGYLEASVLRPLFKSPKEAITPTVDVRRLRRVFLPPSPRESDLPPHARAYVAWGEGVEVAQRQGRARGQRVRLPQLSTLRGRSPWWWLGEWPEAPVALPTLEGSRKLAFANPPKVMMGNKLYLVLPKRGVDSKSLVLALNATVFALFKELLARPPKGGGSIEMTAYDYEAMPVPDPSLWEAELGEDWVGAFLSHPIPPFWEEVGLLPSEFSGEPNPLPHRVALDRPFFEAIGFTEEERKELYRETAKLVWARNSKANSLDEEDEEEG